MKRVYGAFAAVLGQQATRGVSTEGSVYSRFSSACINNTMYLHYLYDNSYQADCFVWRRRAEDGE